LAKQHKN